MHIFPAKVGDTQSSITKKSSQENLYSNSIFFFPFLWTIFLKMAFFWDILSTQKAKFQIWYLSEFLVVLWPKYVT